jgi:hypothetical protein
LNACSELRHAAITYLNQLLSGCDMAKGLVRQIDIGTKRSKADAEMGRVIKDVTERIGNQRIAHS